MKKNSIRVGVIGAGAISDIYLKNMIGVFDELNVTAIASAHFRNARRKAAVYGIKACTTDELLSDPAIEMIVNLTPVGAHFDLIRRALSAGKHVYTEKTLANDLEKAAELLRLAEEKGLYLGAAPDTFLGAALQTVRRAIDNGILGEIHSFSVSANRDNNMLMSMLPFLREPDAGILFDYAVYHVTALVSLLGPVARVAGLTGSPYPTRRNILPESPEYGTLMDTPNESQVSAILSLRNGVTGVLHIDADSNMRDEAHFAIYGTKGILRLTDPNQFGGAVRFLPNAPDTSGPAVAEELPPVSRYQENFRGIGPADMARAILEGGQNRASKEMAYHVLEVLSGVLRSGETESFIRIASSCQRPEPLPVERRE